MSNSRQAGIDCAVYPLNAVDRTTREPNLRVIRIPAVATGSHQMVFDGRDQDFVGTQHKLGLDVSFGGDGVFPRPVNGYVNRLE